ncbi:hypothetical protein B0H14DRAFT_3631371 [Mycena olivaceomarginata]|nr:hypothetical protein B0H14DRAFT_3631371 [Mycena olivaceomarginata]
MDIEPTRHVVHAGVAPVPWPILGTSTPSSSSTRSLAGAPSTDTPLLKTSHPVIPELNSSSVVSGRPPSTRCGLGDGLGCAGPEPAGGGLDLSHDTFGVNLPLFEPLPPPRNLVSEIILPGHTTLALSREALLSLANHHQALANAAFAAAMEVAPPIAHPLNDDSLETVNVSRDDRSVAGNPDIGCNNVEPFEIGPEIPVILATKNPPHRVHLEELGFGFSLESAEAVWWIEETPGISRQWCEAASHAPRQGWAQPYPADPAEASRPTSAKARQTWTHVDRPLTNLNRLGRGKGLAETAPKCSEVGAGVW